MRTQTLSVAALLVATGLTFAATNARAGTPDSAKNGVNERGETYGILRSQGPQPDLIAVVGHDSNGKEVDGYARSGDLWPGDPPSSPSAALAWQAGEGAHGRDIPVFTADGATRLGTFHVTGANEAPTSPVPLG
jgi:hypothetical protein